MCGKSLVYGTEEITGQCSFYGEKHPTLIFCPEGHYICDTCRQRGALEILKGVLSTTTAADPAEISETVMSHPAVPMHGPEHRRTPLLQAVQPHGFGSGR